MVNAAVRKMAYWLRVALSVVANRVYRWSMFLEISRCRGGSLFRRRIPCQAGAISDTHSGVLSVAEGAVGATGLMQGQQWDKLWVPELPASGFGGSSTNEFRWTLASRHCSGLLLTNTTGRHDDKIAIPPLRPLPP